MDFKYAKAVNVAQTEFELLLHGIVGWDIEGPVIAAEIKFLNEALKAEKITLRINSVGGIITEGLGVIAAMLNSKAEIHTFNEGTADSMALVILAAGDSGNRGAFDYATGIIHDPLINGITLEDIEDDKTKGFMQKMKDSLVTIFVNNTGKSREEISEAMTEELMLDATEMLDFNIIDLIQISKKQPKIKANATILERMAACSEIINKSDMEFKSKFEAATAELTTAKQTIEEQTAEIDTKDSRITDLETKVEDLEAKNTAFHDTAKSTAVKAAIDSGKFDATDEDFLKEQCEGLGAEEFTAFVDKVKEPQVRATDFMENGTPTRGAVDENDTSKWDWKTWEKKDPNGLERLQVQNPEKYDKLLLEDEKLYA